MKRSEIKVGQTYKNKLYRGVIYLGVGMSTAESHHQKFENKNLIIVGPENHWGIGRMYQLPEDKKDLAAWEGFYPI